MKNWAALSPGLDRVLFVRTLHSLRHNLPIIGEMFNNVLLASSNPFVGYANVDIPFDRSLLSTQRYLGERLDIS